MPITPDDKDWTWVLNTTCPECGFDPQGWTSMEAGRYLAGYPRPWQQALTGAKARVRPDDETWSPLEYGAHVRDVLRIFRERLGLMLETDGAPFPNWDQDATALEQDYPAQDPCRVLEQITEEAQKCSAAFGAVQEADFARRGLRSNGSQFTVSTLSAYMIHDLQHHVHDVLGIPATDSTRYC